MYSVLQNKKNGKLLLEPFPHLIIDNALPEELYNKLDSSFVDYKKIISEKEYKDNHAYRINAYNSLNDESLNSIWRNFINYHTGFDFLLELFEVFNNDILKYYPSSSGKLPTKENTGVRFSGNHYFNLDSQFVINTPPTKTSSVIEPHLDSAKKLFAGLFYMRNKEDDSIGGNLTTHKFKSEPSFYGQSRVRESELENISEIEYKANRFIVFLNTPFSIHGVTRKETSIHYRKYINMIGAFNFNLFNYKKFLEK